MTDDTATAPSDYDNSSLTVKSADGQTSQTIVVPIVDDTRFEGNETVNLALSNPTGGATIDTQATATLLIIDNNKPPKSDFNGDGQPKILWRNGLSGENVIWSLNGASF